MTTHFADPLLLHGPVELDLLDSSTICTWAKNPVFWVWARGIGVCFGLPCSACVCVSWSATQFVRRAPGAELVQWRSRDQPRALARPAAEVRLG